MQYDTNHNSGFGDIALVKQQVLQKLKVGSKSFDTYKKNSSLKKIITTFKFQVWIHKNKTMKAVSVSLKGNLI